jgi:hypothetical protein
MENLEKFYSTNNEDFRYTDSSELLAALEDDEMLKVGTVYYEADFRRIAVTELISAALVIEQMEERLYDLVGECAEDGITQKEGAEQALKALLADWAEKHTNLSTFYRVVGKSRELRITADDLPAS